MIFYLDSDDYSKLSDTRIVDKSAKLLGILTDLRLLSNKGLIEIRYSIIHVTELVAATTEEKDLPSQRAALLEEICGENVFVRQDELWFRETCSLLGLYDSSATKNLACAENCDWLGLDLGKIGLGFEHIKAKLPATLLAGEYSPEITSQLQKLLIDPSGNLTDYAIIGYLQALGVSQNEIDTLKNSEENLRGMASLSYNKRMLSRILSPSRIVTEPKNFEFYQYHFKDRIDQEYQSNLFNVQEKIAKWQNELITRFIAHPKGILKHFVSISKRFIKKLTVIAAQLWRRQRLESIYKKNQSFFEANNITLNDWENKIQASEIGMLPSLDTATLIHQQAYFDRLIDKEPLQANDIRDYLHACYAPYCDVFRGDKRTIDMLNKIKLKIPTLQNVQLIRKTEDLASLLFDIASKINLA